MKSNVVKFVAFLFAGTISFLFFFSVFSYTAVAYAVGTEEDTVTYAFYYDCISPSDVKKTTLVFRKGESAPQKLSLPVQTPDGEKVVPVLGVFTDPYLTAPVHLPAVAEKDLSFYLLLDLTVRFSFNGEEYNCPYGSPLSAVTVSETAKTEKFYLNEEMTEECPYFYAVNGLECFGERIRTAYEVTLRLENEELKMIVPFGETLDVSFLKEYVDTDDLAFFDGDEEVVFPYVPQGDAVLVLKERPKASDEFYLYIFSGVLFLSVFFAYLIYCLIGKRKRKKRGLNKCIY